MATRLIAVTIQLLKSIKNYNRMTEKEIMDFRLSCLHIAHSRASSSLLHELPTVEQITQDAEKLYEFLSPRTAKAKASQPQEA